jgi:hypothetical protein
MFAALYATLSDLQAGSHCFRGLPLFLFMCLSNFQLQLILSRHMVSREYLKHQAKNYIRSLVFGSLISPTILAGSCAAM